MSSKGNAPNRRVAAIQAKKKRKQPKKSKQGEGQNANKERERNRETRQTQPQTPDHHEIDKNRSFEEVSEYIFYYVQDTHHTDRLHTHLTSVRCVA